MISRHQTTEATLERVTATLDDEVLAEIRRIAGPRGVSRFLNLAARERLARLEVLGMLDELDTKHGPVPKQVRAEVARDARRIFRR
jgi:Arc/MetJ family transcription regulator